MRVFVFSILATLSCLQLAGSLPAADPVPRTQTTKQFAFTTKINGKEDKTKVDYLLFVPEQYNNKRKLPLMLFLHGAKKKKKRPGTNEKIKTTEDRC